MILVIPVAILMWLFNLWLFKLRPRQSTLYYAMPLTLIMAILSYILVIGLVVFAFNSQLGNDFLPHAVAGTNLGLIFGIAIFMPLIAWWNVKASLASTGHTTHKNKPVTNSEMISAALDREERRKARQDE